MDIEVMKAKIIESLKGFNTAHNLIKEDIKHLYQNIGINDHTFFAEILDESLTVIYAVNKELNCFGDVTFDENKGIILNYDKISNLITSPEQIETLYKIMVSTSCCFYREYDKLVNFNERLQHYGLKLNVNALQDALILSGSLYKYSYGRYLHPLNPLYKGLKENFEH